MYVLTSIHTYMHTCIDRYIHTYTHIHKSCSIYRPAPPLARLPHPRRGGGQAPPSPARGAGCREDGARERTQGPVLAATAAPGVWGLPRCSFCDDFLQKIIAKKSAGNPPPALGGKGGKLRGRPEPTGGGTRRSLGPASCRHVSATGASHSSHAQYTPGSRAWARFSCVCACVCVCVCVCVAAWTCSRH